MVAVICDLICNTVGGEIVDPKVQNLFESQHCFLHSGRKTQVLFYMWPVRSKMMYLEFLHSDLEERPSR